MRHLCFLEEQLINPPIQYDPQLGEGLDTEHIEASYDKGMLTVSIPVAEAAKPRKVEIGSGSAAKELIGSAA